MRQRAPSTGLDTAKQAVAAPAWAAPAPSAAPPALADTQPHLLPERGWLRAAASHPVAFRSRSQRRMRSAHRRLLEAHARVSDEAQARMRGERAERLPREQYFLGAASPEHEPRSAYAPATGWSDERNRFVLALREREREDGRRFGALLHGERKAVGAAAARQLEAAAAARGKASLFGRRCRYGVRDGLRSAKVQYAGATGSCDCFQARPQTAHAQAGRHYAVRGRRYDDAAEAALPVGAFLERELGTARGAAAASVLEYRYRSVGELRLGWPAADRALRAHLADGAALAAQVQASLEAVPLRAFLAHELGADDPELAAAGVDWRDVAKFLHAVPTAGELRRRWRGLREAVRASGGGDAAVNKLEASWLLHLGDAPQRQQRGWWLAEPRRGADVVGPAQAQALALARARANGKGKGGGGAQAQGQGARRRPRPKTAPAGRKIMRLPKLPTARVMGQTIGKAAIVPEAKKFVNLPKDAVDQLWESFNDVAEGFGLSIEEFLEITRTALKDTMELSDKKIDQLSAKVFAVLDDDKNDLVDALEFLGAFALLSGMSHDAKANFVFNIYDFDESGELTVDEMTLALRSCITGLAKLSGTEPPLEPEIEKIALNAFADEEPGMNDAGGEALITRAEFVRYCSVTPELTSWIEFFDDIAEFGAAALAARKEGEDGEGGALEMALEVRCEAERQTRSSEHVAAVDPDDGAPDTLAIEARGFAEEFMPQKPWVQVVNYTVPTDVPEIDNTVPDTALELEWVHGYNANSCRNNLRYTVKGEIVYSAAALGVVLNAEEHKQRFANDHCDEINCFAVHNVRSPKPDTLVATGEVGRRPKVCVWSTETMEVLSVLTGLQQNGVTHVDFSPDGEQLVTVGNDDGHSVAVYAWRTRVRLFSAVSTPEKVLDCRFIGDGAFASCGVGHMIFWSQRGLVYEQHTGIFGKKGKPQTMLCVGCIEHTVVSGTDSGHLYVWDGRNCRKSIQAHNDGINAMFTVDGPEGGLVTGSRDGKVRLWNALLEPGATFEIGGLGGVASSVRSVAWDVELNKILVGTSGSEVYEISATDGADLHLGPLVQGHCADELWGLAVHPFQAEF
eukprot:g3926.t1